MGTYNSKLQLFKVFYFEGGRLFQALHPNLGSVLFDVVCAALCSLCEGALHNWFKQLKLFLGKDMSCLVVSYSICDPTAYVQTRDPASGCCLILTVW